MGSGDDDGASGSGLAGGAGSANAVKQVSRPGGAHSAASGTATSSAAASGTGASGAAPSSEAASGHEFRATGDPVAFQVLAKRFLGPVVGQVRQAHAAGGTGVKNLDREIRE